MRKATRFPEPSGSHPNHERLPDAASWCDCIGLCDPARDAPGRVRYSWPAVLSPRATCAHAA
nr:hypothetical protein [Cupriavidus pauculus]